jgi:hypothetical protein
MPSGNICRRSSTPRADRTASALYFLSEVDDELVDAGAAGVDALSDFDPLDSVEELDADLLSLPASVEPFFA